MNIKELNEEINYYIDNYPENAIVLSKIKERINKIENQLKEEYSLIFMAEKGAGKTTTIDFLLGLTYEREKVNEKTKKKYIVEEDILETGSGATTTSEVEICQSNDEYSKIIITPYEIEDVKDILITFAKAMFSNIHEIEGIEEQLAPELIRACRNMTGLTERKNEEGIKVDLLKELVLQFNENEYDSFESRILESANLESRNKIEFICDEKKDKEKAWIKKIFRRVNLVHIDDAPLPKKITLMLSKDIFDFDKLNRITKIIDTRGLEVASNTDRSDIKSIFRDGENQIILFVDKFNSPSKSIIDLVDHYVYDKDMDIIDRLGYIVNFRDGEAEKVVGCDGIIENEEDGINEKRKQVVQIFKDNNVYIKDENIIYCNPKRNLDQEGRIKISIDELEEYDYDQAAIIMDKKEERAVEHDVFVDNVISFVDDYEEKLLNQRNLVIKNYEDIRAQIEKNATIDVKPITDYIENHEVKISLKEKIAKIYENYISNKFPSTLRAINNRFGIYGNYDIYCEGANVIESYLKKALKEFKDEIINQINVVNDNKNLNSNQEKAKQFMIIDINKFFFRYIEEINSIFYSNLKEDIFATTNDEFWVKVKSRWGKGSGYRKDVVIYYEDNIRVKGMEDYIDSQINRIVEEFKRELVNILNDSHIES